MLSDAAFESLALLTLLEFDKGLLLIDSLALLLDGLLECGFCITFTFGTIFLYTGELFPTEVRTSGIGSANFIGELSIHPSRT